MKLKWLGHSAFLITSDKGVKIITDPYEVGAYGAINYDQIEDSADIVTVSHSHADHSNVAGVTGNPEVVDEPGTKEVKGVTFKGLPCYHDAFCGKKRGRNIIFCFNVDGLTVCHLGDLGHDLSDEQVSLMGKVDLLLIPVGGNFTIDGELAAELCGKIKPRVVVPMHYRTPKCYLPVASVEDFLRKRANVAMPAASEVELKLGKLPKGQTLVLAHAL